MVVLQIVQLKNFRQVRTIVLRSATGKILVQVRQRGSGPAVIEGAGRIRQD